MENKSRKGRYTNIWEFHRSNISNNNNIIINLRKYIVNNLFFLEEGHHIYFFNTSFRVIFHKNV